MFLAAEPGDVAIGPSGSVAAARCKHEHHPARDSIALVASPAATPTDVRSVLDRVCGLSPTAARVRVAAGDEFAVDAVRSAGLRLAVTSREWLVDCDAAEVIATARAATSGVTGLRAGHADVSDPAFLAALRDHYAAVHQWDPPAPLGLERVTELLLAGAVEAATEAAWRDDGTLVGVSVVHASDDEDDVELAGDVAYCGPSNVDDPAAAGDVARLLLASRVLATSGVLRVEVDEGDGANGPLAGALAPYPVERAGPDVLIYVTP